MTDIITIAKLAISVFSLFQNNPDPHQCHEPEARPAQSYSNSTPSYPFSIPVPVTEFKPIVIDPLRDPPPPERSRFPHDPNDYCPMITSEKELALAKHLYERVWQKTQPLNDFCRTIVLGKLHKL